MTNKELTEEMARMSQRIAGLQEENARLAGVNAQVMLERDAADKRARDNEQALNVVGQRVSDIATLREDAVRALITVINRLPGK